MTRPDDSLLTVEQLATVRRAANRLLREADGFDRFPTPIADIMLAAKLTVVDDEVLNEGFVHQFIKKAKSGIVAIKSAFSKVLGLFESHERLVIIDKSVPEPKIPFIKLHEAGHGTLPHQSMAYRLIQDCAKTLDADTTDLFEREANMFAAEALFQGDVFTREAAELSFGVKAPMTLARKFGASNYAAFRRYVSVSPLACCVVVLEPSTYGLDGKLAAYVRRVVMSRSFALIHDGNLLCSTVIGSHPLVPIVPRYGRRMTPPQEIVLIDRNREERFCVAEAFNTTHQTLILIRDAGKRTRAGIVVPAVPSLKAAIARP